jgi:dienelactone hydrolase
MSNTAGSPWFGRIDTQTAGAVGHSFGGATSTFLCAEDKRVRASVNLDGWYFGAIEARGPNQPLLTMDAFEPESKAARTTSDPDSILDATDVAELKASLLKYGGYSVLISGAEHDDFTDQPLVSPLRRLSHRGTIPASKMQTIVRSYVLAFFEQELRHKDADILQAGSHPFADASLEVWPPDNRRALSSINRAGNETVQVHQ